MTEHHPEGPSGRSEAGLPPDEPSAEVVEQARRAFTTPAGELLPLVFDSLVDADDEPEAHQLRFERPDLAVQLDVAARLEGTEITGWVGPDVPRMALYIRGADLAVVSPVEDGRFGFHPVPHGLVRLMIERSGSEAHVWTEWFRV